MSKHLSKELDELTGAEIISEETAGKIREYYKNKEKNSPNRLVIVFAVLGAMLVGLGIILIVAHNWDNLSRNVKVVLSFLPLLVGQICCGYTLLKKNDSIAWRESSSVFLFLAVGTSISLVGQIYNIHDDLGRFLISWMLLCLPLVYVMRSSVCSLLYIGGITYYQLVSNGWSGDFFHHHESYNYWWLLLLIVPHYYLLFKKEPNSNYLGFHNWLVPISLIISVGPLADHADQLMFAVYMSLFGLFYIIGSSEFVNKTKRRVTGYQVFGVIGTLFILLMLSFDEFWKDIQRKDFSFDRLYDTPEFISILIISTLAILAFVFMNRKKQIENLHPMQFIFVLFFLIFILGCNSVMAAVILVNLLVLIIGVFAIWRGAKTDHLGILNYGLICITLLIICRFFDSNLSFVIRGLLFVLLGAGFFLANFLMLKKRKRAELDKDFIK